MTTSNRNIMLPVRWLLLAVCLIAGLPTTEAQEQDIQRKARIAADLAATRFGRPPVRLIFNDGSEIRVLADASVEVGIPRLKSLLEGKSNDEAMVILRFVLGHEIWHVRQIEAEKVDLFGPMRAVDRVLLECQADAMGAMFAATVSVGEIETLGPALRDVIQLAGALGTHGLPGDLHPTVEQRGTTVRLAFSRVIASAMSADLQPSPTTELAVGNLEKVADVRSDEDEMAWARRICKKVVHFDPSVLRQIGFGLPKIVFNTNPDSPFVSYQLPLRNRGDRPMKVALSIVSSVVDLQGRRAVLSTRAIHAVENFEITLRPDESLTLNGVLPWYSEGERRPLLEADMKSPYALISAEYSGPLSDVSCLGQSPRKLSSDERALRNLLERIAAAAPTNFDGVTSGQPTVLGDTTLYDVSVSMPGLTDGEASINQDGSASVSFTAYKGSDLAAGMNAYQQWKRRLERICPRSAVRWEERVYKDLPHADIERVSRNASLTLHLRQRRDSAYKLTIDISKRQGP